MDDLGFYLVSSCLYFVILWESLDIFFDRKKTSVQITLTVWILFYVIEIAEAVVIKEPVFRLLFQIVCTYIFCALLYYGSARKRLIWIVSFNMLGSLCEMVVAYLLLFLQMDAYSDMTFGSVLSKILMLLLLAVLKLFHFSKIKREISFRNWCSLFVIMLGNLFVTGAILYVCQSVDDRKALFLAVLSSAFLMVIDFWIVYIYDDMAQRMEMQKEEILFDKQIELIKNQIKERKDLDQNVKNIKHDIKNHLLCIQECLERKDFVCAGNYIDDLIQGDNFLKEKEGIFHTGNLVIDALINYKGLVMQQQGIRMDSRIEIPAQIDVKDADICVILGNCLDNAIEAVSRIQEPGHKYISMELVYRRNCFLCKITNPYAGYIEKDKRGNYISTKEEAQHHGVGLLSVKKAVEKYDGQMDISSENRTFSLRILLYTAGKNYI